MSTLLQAAFYALHNLENMTTEEFSLGADAIYCKGLEEAIIQSLVNKPCPQCGSLVEAYNIEDDLIVHVNRNLLACKISDLNDVEEEH